MRETVIYPARAILTLARARPRASHVAVREGRILGVGDLEELARWGPYRLDARFADHVLTPGFVEGHAHLLAGGVWRFVYVGAQARSDPDGGHWPGVETADGVIARLKEAAAKLAPEAPLIGWGFDPIFLPPPRLSRHDLDRVSDARPIAVMHSNFHLMTVNTAALKLAGLDQAKDILGVVLGEDGRPNGELQEMAAMFPIMRRLKIDIEAIGESAESARAFAKAAVRAGVTTSTDLYSALPERGLEELLRVTGEADFPLRLVPALNALGSGVAEIRERALELRGRSTDKLRLGAVKIMTDGSIQGYTGRLLWPGYVTGAPNGIWNIAPEQLFEATAKLHRAGLQMHIHTNGDEASQVALDALQAAIEAHPRPDHRHTLQHVQMADAAQFRRMAALGVAANLFANHLWYFGDKHYEATVGPERASAMNACASALGEGVRLAIHSDAPVTPLGPLFTAWCAVNRETPSGRVLGAGERISVEAALHAITLGAAYTLHLDHEIGSIEAGKRADFAVLEADPLEVGADGLKNIAVAGVVAGGEPHLV